MAASPAQLCLFNQPRMELSGTQIEVRPPLAFLVLVALALSKPRIQSRSEIAKLLFPSVDPKERRSQLRIVLSQLRKRLSDLEIDGLYSENGTDLYLHESVTLDATELVRGETLSPTRLAAFAQPVLVGCQSRFAEKCRNLVKNTVEASLPTILSQCGLEDLWTITPTLGRLNALYPLSATICASHVAVLRYLHLYEEATVEIAEFETDWLETFGAQDKPQIDSVARQLSARLPNSAVSAPVLS